MSGRSGARSTPKAPDAIGPRPPVASPHESRQGGRTLGRRRSPGSAPPRAVPGSRRRPRSVQRLPNETCAPSQPSAAGLPGATPSILAGHPARHPGPRGPAPEGPRSHAQLYVLTPAPAPEEPGPEPRLRVEPGPDPQARPARRPPARAPSRRSAPVAGPVRPGGRPPVARRGCRARPGAPRMARFPHGRPAAAPWAQPARNPPDWRRQSSA
jgi:hypothetical protein